MGGEVRREEPPVADGVLRIRFAVKGVDPAARTGHRGHGPVAAVALVVVGHPRVDVARPRADFPVAAQVVPAEDAAQGVFPLAVFEVALVGVVGRQHRQLAVRVDVPGVQPETVAASGVVVDLLQDVHVVEGAASVALDGIVRPDDVLVLVVDVLLLVAVAVLEVVFRRLVDGAGRDLPAFVAPRQAQEFVEGAEHADTLDVLQSESVGGSGCGRELHHAAQRTARLVERGGAVQQRGVVDEVRRNRREVGHAEHRVVDAHAVPHDLRVRGSRAAERDGRERRPAVLLDEDRRIEGQHVGHREGDVLLEHRRIEAGLFDADAFHRALSPDRNFADADARFSAAWSRFGGGFRRAERFAGLGPEHRRKQQEQGQ